jgi:uncharacterized cofD-like protein
MKWRPRGALRWLYPGMRVKRWLLLAFGCTLVIMLALMYALGVELMRFLYRALPLSASTRYAVMAGLLLCGIGGFSYSIMRLVRSIARGVAPTSHEKPSAMIYRTRVLERGPRVVAIGGGTGLSTLLRGIKQVTSNLTAVVTVTDDGGSSGRLREEIDVLPPGDVRNCLLALAEDEGRFADYFQYRFVAPAELAGHSLGNLVLAGLEQATGGFDRAIEAMSQFLSVRGRVLPATLAKTHLVARMEDGETLEGESKIGIDPRRIAELSLASEPVPAYERVLQAIAEADLILLGPGSLYTSLIPNLLVEPIASAIEDAAAEKILIANLMTQPCETQGFSLADHLRALDRYVSVRTFDLLLVNAARPPEPLLAGYRSEAAEPVRDDLGSENPYGLRLIREDLIGTADWSGKTTVKHDPEKLAKALLRYSRTFGHRRPTSASP